MLVKRLSADKVDLLAEEPAVIRWSVIGGNHGERRGSLNMCVCKCRRPRLDCKNMLLVTLYAGELLARCQRVTADAKCKGGRLRRGAVGEGCGWQSSHRHWRSAVASGQELNGRLCGMRNCAKLSREKLHQQCLNI